MDLNSRVLKKKPSNASNDQKGGDFGRSGEAFVGLSVRNRRGSFFVLVREGREGRRRGGGERGLTTLSVIREQSLKRGEFRGTILDPERGKVPCPGVSRRGGSCTL